MFTLTPLQTDSLLVTLATFERAITHAQATVQRRRNLRPSVKAMTLADNELRLRDIRLLREVVKREPEVVGLVPPTGA